MFAFDKEFGDGPVTGFYGPPVKTATFPKGFVAFCKAFIAPDPKPVTA